MAEGRRGFLAGLLLGMAPLVAAEAAPSDDLLVQAQYVYGRARRWRAALDAWGRVVTYDRSGGPRRRIVEREVCAEPTGAGNAGRPSRGGRFPAGARSAVNDERAGPDRPVG